MLFHMEEPWPREGMDCKHSCAEAFLTLATKMKKKKKKNVRLHEVE